MSSAGESAKRVTDNRRGRTSMQNSAGKCRVRLAGRRVRNVECNAMEACPSKLVEENRCPRHTHKSYARHHIDVAYRRSSLA